MSRQDRHRDRESDRRPGREPPTSSRRPTLNEYFVDGEGIDRQVLQSELCRFLGPDATCKPADYNGLKGYKIKAPRPFTSEMLIDLKQLSEKYVQENRRYPGDLPWEESDTSRVWNHTGYPPGQPGNAGFPPMSSPFGSDMPPNFPPSGYPGGQGYPQFSSMAPAMGGVQASSMQPDFRGGPHYTMSSQAPREYPPGGYYPTSGGFDSAPRVTREPGGPSYYPPGAGPSQEPPRGGGFYDPSMDMTGTRGGDYGMANRPPPNGSPYDPGNREPYVSRQPPQDPYASRGGRRP